MLIEIQITKKMIQVAQQKSIEMGKLNNSITEGEGNLAGFIGEAMVAHFFRVPLVNTYDFDVIYKNIKIDVKTKRTTVEPKPYYECSVADYNIKQDCDGYLFTRVLNNLEKGWLLGYIPKAEYYQMSIKHRKGEIDPQNNFRFKADCYNLSIEKLYSVIEYHW